MIAGSLAVCLGDVDDPLQPYHEPGVEALDVEPAQTDIDGNATVQTGTIAGKVPQSRRVVSITDGDITDEMRERDELVASDWVADVTGDGWIVTESTHPTGGDFGPPWPFSTFERVTGTEITPVNVDPGAFATAQDDADRDTVTEFVGRRTGKDDVSIDWGREATNADAREADIGVALTTLWRGEFVRICVYQSGYIAAWEPEEWSPSAFARFVGEEIIPHAFVPEDDDEDEQQATLGETTSTSDLEADVSANLGRDV